MVSSVFSGPLRTIVSGGIGGVALWVAIFPADVVKSRVQIASTSGTIEPTFRSVITTIYKQEGKDESLALKDVHLNLKPCSFIFLSEILLFD